MTKYDKHGNIVSMYEIVKGVGEKEIIKENITLLTRDHTTLLQSENIEDINDIKNALIIEAYLTKNNKKIRQLKGDPVYLFNNTKDIFPDRPLDNSVGDDNKMDENVVKTEN